MSTLSKSCLFVAREALATGAETLKPYAHKYSPKRYTQAQRFACLVLTVFFQKDYRGLATHLAEHAERRAALGLKGVPHFTTLPKASRRLLRLPVARRRFPTTVRRFLGRRKRGPRAAFDSTGLDGGRRSSSYVRRRSGTARRWQTVLYRRFAKLELSLDCSSHLRLAVGAGRGPRVDVDRFVPLLDATLEQVRLGAVLADAGSDSEPNHRHAREKGGVRSFIPAAIGRPPTKPPPGRYRRQMKQRLDKHYGRYGQRWQAATGISMLKRCLASKVNGHTYGSQCRDLWLLAITYNIMLC